MPLEKKEQLEKEQEKQRKQRTKEEWKTVVSKPVEQAVTHTHAYTYVYIHLPLSRCRPGPIHQAGDGSPLPKWEKQVPAARHSAAIRRRIGRR